MPETEHAATGRARHAQPQKTTETSHAAAAAAEWHWEQDTQFRFTRAGPPHAHDDPGPAAWIGARCWDLPGATALTLTWEEHRAMLSARLPFHDFQFVWDHDGQPSCVSCSGRPRFDAQGRFAGYEGVARDATPAWRQRARLDDAQALLGVAAALGRFGAWSIELPTGLVRWTEQTRAIHEAPLSRECEAEHVLEMYAPEHRPVLLDAFQRCVREGTPYDLEVQALTASAQRVWVRVIGVPVRDAAGRTLRVQGAFQDIHKSKLVAEEHRHHAQRLRATLDSLIDGFATIDRQWRITYGNPAAEAMLQVRLADVAGRSVWDIFPAARGTAFEENYRRTMEDGQVRRFEAYLASHGIWIRASAFPSGRGIAVSFADATAAVQARELQVRQNEELERRVQDRTEALERLNQELSAFTLAVAHDLRAPLAGLGGFCRALADHLQPGQDARAAHYLSRIQHSASRMEELLQGLLELSGIGRATLAVRTVDLSVLASDAFESLRAAAPARQVQLQVQDGLRVQGDARLLRTLLENLLGNAWKFTAGCVPARIAFGRQADGSFFVRDNGAGFDMAYAADLFAPFRRLHSQDEFEGLGIGLASARRVVERHGGRIWAESSPGAGATFRFTLAESPKAA